MDPHPPPPPDRSFAKKSWGIVAGLAVFMPINMVVLSVFTGRRSLAAGLVFAAATVGVTALLYRLRWRWPAIGISVGFAVMTIVTGGVCTLFRYKEYGEFAGLFYLLIVVLAVAAAGVASAVEAGRSGRA
ncbi:MAG TPA: hypothetical protein VGJ83_07295 [Gemmatimonadales bacterium]